MPFSHTYALLAGEEDEGYCYHSCSFYLLIMMEIGWYGRKGDAFTGPISALPLAVVSDLGPESI